jgi:glutaminyl-peptide cyclotransferase
MKTFILTSLLALLSLVASCNSTPPVKPEPPKPEVKKAAHYGYEVVRTYPHDPEAFTQGLIFRDGKLLESTGQEGESTLRSVDLYSGQVIKKVDIASPYFAEGMTVMNGKIYQLTWQHQLGFIYDYQTFEKVGQFKYQGEGWGLTNDGTSLILSDGSSRIRFIDPNSFLVTRTINVTDEGRSIRDLNELEFINGEIYANIWHDQRIVTINPQTGVVTAWIDFSGLLRTPDPEAVLNGIAVDEATGRLFVTGKLWPKLFEVKIKK